MVAVIVAPFQGGKKPLVGLLQAWGWECQICIACFHELDSTVTARLPSSAPMQMWVVTDTKSWCLNAISVPVRENRALSRKPTADSNMDNVRGARPQLFITWGFNLWATVPQGGEVLPTTAICEKGSNLTQQQNRKSGRKVKAMAKWTEMMELSVKKKTTWVKVGFYFFFRINNHFTVLLKKTTIITEKKP